MHVYVCMYMCLSMYMYVCICMYMYVCICMCMYVSSVLPIHPPGYKKLQSQYHQQF